MDDQLFDAMNFDVADLEHRLGSHPVVAPELRSVVHFALPKFFRLMDCRVKPGNDS